MLQLQYFTVNKLQFVCTIERGSNTSYGTPTYLITIQLLQNNQFYNVTHLQTVHKLNKQNKVKIVTNKQINEHIFNMLNTITLN